MADNARDQDLNLEAEIASADQDDPLFELAQLMGDSPPVPTQPKSAAPVVEVAVPVVTAEPLPPVASAPPADAFDLEAQLLAELGGEPKAHMPMPAPTLSTPPIVAYAPVEAAVDDFAPIAETISPSIEDELSALLAADPVEPVARVAAPVVTPPEPEEPVHRAATVETFVEPVVVSERVDPRQEVAAPETITDALDTNLDDFMFVDFEADEPEVDFEESAGLEPAPAPFVPPPFVVDDEPEAYREPIVEPESASEFDVRSVVEPEVATVEPVIHADIPAIEPDEAVSEDELFAGFDDALDDEFDALFDDEIEKPAVEQPAVEQVANDAVIDPAMTYDAPETPSAGAYITAAAGAVAVGAAGLGSAKDTGDDLLAHIGLNEEVALSPLDELNAIMNEPSVQQPAMPDVHTTDIAALDDSDFSDFDVPDLPHEASIPAAPVTAGSGFSNDDLDFDLDIEGELNATEISHELPDAPLDIDEAFATDDFEAELAKDMEFASHTRAAPLTSDDEFFGEPEADVAVAADQAPAKKRGFMVAGIIVAVAALGGLGVFAMSSGGADLSSGPVIVEADTSPIKVEPEEPGGANVPNQDRALFNGDSDANLARQEQLVTTSEEPVDIANAPGAVLPSAVAGKDDQRLLPNVEPDVSGNEPVTSVSPRRVRTLVVRSDGTLVEQPVAVPSIIAEVTDTVTEAATGVASDVAATVTENTGVAFTPPAVATAPTRPTGTTQVPVRTVETRTITPPIVADRPNNQPVNIVNPQPQQNTQVALAPQPAAPAPAAASSPFAVQIASVPSREGAQQSAVNLQQRYSNVLSGRGVSIQQAQIEGRGTFYRVRVGAQSRADANALCEQYKRAGGSCFVTR